MRRWFYNGELVFRKYTIERVCSGEDRCGTKCLDIHIDSDGWGSILPLYENDLKLLLGLFDCH